MGRYIDCMIVVIRIQIWLEGTGDLPCRRSEVVEGYACRGDAEVVQGLCVVRWDIRLRDVRGWYIVGRDDEYKLRWG